MATLKADLPRWATGGAGGTPTVTEPSGDNKDLGWDEATNPIRAHANWKDLSTYEALLDLFQSGIAQWASDIDYPENGAANVPGVGPVVCVNAAGSVGDEPELDDGTNWVNMIPIHVVASTSQAYGIPLKKGTIIVSTSTLSRYIASAVLPASNSVLSGDVVEITSPLSEITTTANTWTAPQRAAIKNIPFASSISLDLASSQNFRITVDSSGAWSIANPFCDTITVTVDEVADSTLYTTSINGTDFSHTTAASGATALTIAAALVSAINAGSEPVTASDNGDGTYDLTADISGTLFTLTQDIRQRNSIEGQSGDIYIIFEDAAASAPSWPDPATTGVISFGDEGIPSATTGRVVANYRVERLDIARGTLPPGVILTWGEQ